jgi:NAD(P)-dependent dehydrogenase (short-subunit alcohol dehydrogenase family)
MSNIDLDGTVVAMTSASLGLGKSMSLALARAGARVALGAPELDLSPAGMPTEVVATLNRGIAESIKMPEVTERMAQQGLIPVGSSSANFAAFQRRDGEVSEDHPGRQHKDQQLSEHMVVSD